MNKCKPIRDTALCIKRRFPKAAAAAMAALLLCSCTEIESDDSSAETSLTVITYADRGITVSSDTDNYIYDQLSETEKRYYDELKSAVESFSERVQYSGEIDTDTARKIFLAVYNQEPQLFWFDSIFYPPRDSSQLLNYRFNKDEASEKLREIQQISIGIINATEGLSDYEKILYFHDYLVRSCEFSADNENLTIYSTFCKGYAQCEGYAFSFKYLCDLAGIDCITVTGTNSDGETHAWNIAALNGIWYNVDCTWDDPILENGSSDFLRRYYLLVPDSDILNVTHFRNDDYFVYPQCYDGSRTYFARAGYYAGSASEGVEMLEAAAIQALSEGHKDAEVRFESESDYKSAIRTLFSFGDIKRLASSALERAGLDSSDSISGMVKYTNDDLRIIHITFG